MAQLVTPELQQSLVMLVTAVLGAAATFVSKKLSDWLGAKADHAKTERAKSAAYLAEAVLDQAVNTAVGFVQQTIVSKAVKGGTWNDAAKEGAKKSAMEMLGHLLGSQGVSQVLTSFNLKPEQLETFLSAKIEQALAERR